MNLSHDHILVISRCMMTGYTRSAKMGESTKSMKMQSTYCGTAWEIFLKKIIYQEFFFGLCATFFKSVVKTASKCPEEHFVVSIFFKREHVYSELANKGGKCLHTGRMIFFSYHITTDNYKTLYYKFSLFLVISIPRENDGKVVDFSKYFSGSF